MDEKFHGLIIGDNASKWLKGLIHVLNTGGSRAFLLLSDIIAVRAEEAYNEHLATIEAIKQGNLKRAGMQMAIHLNNMENGC